MNPITKLTNIFRCRTGFMKKPVHESEDKPKAQRNAVYSESGWIAEVEILADDSDTNQYRYTLRVVQTLTDGFLGHLHDGHIFKVFAVKQYAAYCGWRLSTADF